MGTNGSKSGEMINFFKQSVFPYIISVAIAVMIVMTMYGARQGGWLYLFFLAVPALLLLFIYRKE